MANDNHSAKKRMQDQTVKESLFNFIKKHVPDANLNLIDDIMLSYLVAIVEDVREDSTFDVQELCDTMAGYFPALQSLQPSAVCEWLFEIQSQLDELEKRAPASRASDKESSVMDIALAALEHLPQKTNKYKGAARLWEELEQESVSPASNRVVLTAVSGSQSEPPDGVSLDNSIELLQEMFPNVCSMEVRHCWTIASGDLEHATQLLIDRQESGQSISQSASVKMLGGIQSPQATKHVDEAELKNRIIERYSYIDADSVHKEHHPVVPKVEPKKMVRYRNSKIVSLKGERYTELKKGEDVDDVSMHLQAKGSKKGGGQHHPAGGAGGTGGNAQQ